MLRIASRLPDDLESLVTRTIGCCVRVHCALGPGLLESIYAQAVCIELQASRIPFEREQRVALHYRGQFLCYQCLDLVVADQIVVELKAVERHAPVHYAQVLSYLRASKKQIGLLVNFNVPVLQEGLKRIVL